MPVPEFIVLCCHRNVHVPVLLFSSGLRPWTEQHDLKLSRACVRACVIVCLFFRSSVDGCVQARVRQFRRSLGSSFPVIDLGSIGNESHRTVSTVPTVLAPCTRSPLLRCQVVTSRTADRRAAPQLSRRELGILHYAATQLVPRVLQRWSGFLHFGLLREPLLPEVLAQPSAEGKVTRVIATACTRAEYKSRNLSPVLQRPAASRPTANPFSEEGCLLNRLAAGEGGADEVHLCRGIQ